MISTRKAQLIAGACLLVLLMVIAAFSVGVYFGQTMAGRRPTPLQLLASPQQARPKPGGAGAPTLSFPEGQPALVGIVASAGRQSVTVRTQTGARTISIDEATIVRHYDGGAATIHDLGRGEAVAAFGDLDPTTRQLRANALVLLPSGGGR